MTTYKILRFYRDDHPTEVIKRGLTLEEAKAHCKNPETSSTTCTTKIGRARTSLRGPWFDGFDEE